MKKFWHVFGSFVAIAATVYSSDIQHAITVHPQLSTGLTLAWGIIGNLIQSPIAADPNKPIAGTFKGE
jgi:hypothetical protein